MSSNTILLEFFCPVKEWCWQGTFMPLVTVVGENCQKEHFLWLFTFTFITKLWYIQVDIFTTLECNVTLQLCSVTLPLCRVTLPLCSVSFPLSLYCLLLRTRVSSLSHFHCVLSLSHFLLCIVTFPFSTVYCHFPIFHCELSLSRFPLCIVTCSTFLFVWRLRREVPAVYLMKQ